MRTKLFIVNFLIIGLVTNVFGQVYDTFELSFTAKYQEEYRPLDSILIMNISSGNDTMLFAPDTVLLVACENPTNIDQPKLGTNSFHVSPNYPNPPNGHTKIDISIEREGLVQICIYDLSGRQHAYYERILEGGKHTFSFYPGNANFYIFSVTYTGLTKSIKIVNPVASQSHSSVIYHAYENEEFKATYLSLSYFHMHQDDTLRFIGYASTPAPFPVRGGDAIDDVPEMDETYIFNIAPGPPCADVPIVKNYYSKDYRTVQIGTQCWLQENLNVGTMIPGTSSMTNNGFSEKYCYNDSTVYCDVYGAFYQWDEVMKYETVSGAQGLCPPGWHIPTDEEFKQLEGTVDSQYGYPDPVWDTLDYRGLDAGQRLRTKTHWDNSIGYNYFGFSALGTGCRRFDGVFLNKGNYTSFWTSDEDNANDAWYRYVEYWRIDIARYPRTKIMGRSVRCLKDN